MALKKSSRGREKNVNVWLLDSILINICEIIGMVALEVAQKMSTIGSYESVMVRRQQFSFVADQDITPSYNVESAYKGGNRCIASQP